MSEDDPRRLQAEPPPDLGRRRVSQLVRVPWCLPGLEASYLNRPAVAAHRVALARGLSWPGLRTGDLTGLHPTLSIGPLLGPPLFHRLGRAE